MPMEEIPDSEPERVARQKEARKVKKESKRRREERKTSPMMSEATGTVPPPATGSSSSDKILNHRLTSHYFEAKIVSPSAPGLDKDLPLEGTQSIIEHIPVQPESALRFKESAYEDAKPRSLSRTSLSRLTDPYRPSTSPHLSPLAPLLDMTKDKNTPASRNLRNTPTSVPTVPPTKPVRAKRSKTEPAYAIMDIDWAKILHCPCCQSKWTSRKSTKGKISHLKSCAPEHNFSEHVVCDLLSDAVSETQHYPSPDTPATSAPEPTDPSTLLEDVVRASNVPKKRGGGRHPPGDPIPTVSVRNVADSREAIRKKAARLGFGSLASAVPAEEQPGFTEASNHPVDHEMMPLPSTQMLPPSRLAGHLTNGGTSRRLTVWDDDDDVGNEPEVGSSVIPAATQQLAPSRLGMTRSRTTISTMSTQDEDSFRSTPRLHSTRPFPFPQSNVVIPTPSVSTERISPQSTLLAHSSYQSPPTSTCHNLENASNNDNDMNSNVQPYDRTIEISSDSDYNPGSSSLNALSLPQVSQTKTAVPTKETANDSWDDLPSAYKMNALASSLIEVENDMKGGNLDLDGDNGSDTQLEDEWGADAYLEWDGVEIQDHPNQSDESVGVGRLRMDEELSPKHRKRRSHSSSASASTIASSSSALDFLLNEDTRGAPAKATSRPLSLFSKSESKTTSKPKTTANIITVKTKGKSKASDEYIPLSDESHVFAIMRAMITNDPTLHLRVLRYEPINFDVFYDLALAQNLNPRGLKPKLRAFLDLANISFQQSGPGGPRVRKRAGRK